MRRPEFAVGLAAAWLLTGCGGDGVPGFRSNEGLSVAHPRDVAIKVNGHVAEIEKGLALNRPLERQKGQVNPGPCGHEEDRRHVKGWGDANPNPNRDSWYVDYSPYSIKMISWVDVEEGVNIREVLIRLRNYLQKSAWHVSYTQVGVGHWELKAESPDIGYGGIVDGSAKLVGGHRRIGVTFSSPCFRHPDALPKA